jgi:hypothetical protein
MDRKCEKVESRSWNGPVPQDRVPHSLGSDMDSGGQGFSASLRWATAGC